MDPRVIAEARRQGLDLSGGPGRTQVFVGICPQDRLVVAFCNCFAAQPAVSVISFCLRYVHVSGRYGPAVMIVGVGIFCCPYTASCLYLLYDDGPLKNGPIVVIFNIYIIRMLQQFKIVLPTYTRFCILLKVYGQGAHKTKCIFKNT